MNQMTTLPPVQLDTRYTQDVIPVLDTSKFEHMQRIAIVMAKSSVIPESLRMGKDAVGKDCELPEETVVANCFRIVNQAVRWGFDPFAVADCASIVHGRLMWEGKLVAAVIDAKLGIKLDYTFNDRTDDQMAVTVSGTLPNEKTPRTLEGTVKQWHRGPKSPWANPLDWKRQLRYRGAREWARAFAPAVLLGIYADDELQEIAALDVPTGQRALRFKDVTPVAPQITPPDIPDDIPETPVDQTPTEPDIPDAAITDEAGLLEKLQSDYSVCDSEDEVAALKKDMAPLIKRMSKAGQKKAKAILEGEE